MFGSSLVKMNTSYLNNSTYGYNTGMSYGYSMPQFSFNSVFSMGFTPPVMPMFGGCCSGYGNFGWFNIPFMQNFMDMMTAFSTLSTTNNIINRTSNSSDYSNNTSGSGYSNPLYSWMPTFSTNYSYKTNSSKKSKTNYTFHTSSFNTNTNLPALKDVGYNSDKGYKLAKDIAGNAVGFTSNCALYVRKSLDRTGLGTGERGDGCDYAGILSRNPNFKEVSSKDVSLSSLPAGCILVYDRGAAGYSSSAGHVEVTLGNGQAVSDGVTNNIRQGARVFVPV